MPWAELCNMGGKLTTPSPRVCIVGVGLIGGSIGMALRRFGGASEVVGADPSSRVLEKALELGAIDRALPLADAVSSSHVVILAAPVAAIPSLFVEISPFLSPGTLVTDTGSVKGTITKAAQERLPSFVTFVGGHPMAGAETSGVEAADPFLMQNAVYALTPVGTTPREAVEELTRLIHSVGAIPKVMAPADHDHVVAAVSHLPHVTAAALVNSVRDLLGDKDLLSLAAGGFRDTTRIASGNPSLWREILSANRDEVVAAIDKFQDEMTRMRTALMALETSGSATEITALLGAARETRQLIPAYRKGLLAPMFEMVVHVEDRPGAIAGIAETLADCGVNIRDIEIVRLREGVGGSVRVGVDSAEALQTGVNHLAARGYTARPL